MKQSEIIRRLLERHLQGQLTEEERQELDRIMQDAEQEELVKQELGQLLKGEEPVDGEHDAWQPVLQRVLSVDKTEGQTGAVIRSMRYRWMRWSAAAVFLLVAGGVLFFRLHKEPVTSLPAPAVAAIHPGGNRAILTLANGQQINLDDAQKGVVSQQGSSRVMKLDSGRLAYDPAAGNVGEGVLYNTISTPRGGQYEVSLADGTKVWLNAESSLRYPTVFAGSDREVQLTGEAYFEVADNKSKPFVVKAGGTVTRVLGTHFNIMAYTDEGAVRTTLLEGKVSMGWGEKQALLKPGEQGLYDDDRGSIVTRSVNTRAVVAWKDGYYYFDRTPVGAVMRQIARWYNVDIVYAGAVPRDEIVGKIPRSADVSDVLHIMELIGIRFRIENRKIIVL